MSTNSEKDLNVIAPSGKKIIVGGVDFEVKPFVLKNRIKFVKLVSEVFLDMSSNVTEEVQKAPIKAIPLLIQTAGEKLVDVYELVLGKDKEWLLDNVQIRDEVEILTAIFEVNDIPFIVRRIQEVLPRVIQKV